MNATTIISTKGFTSANAYISNPAGLIIVSVGPDVNGRTMTAGRITFAMNRGLLSEKHVISAADDQVLNAEACNNLLALAEKNKVGKQVVKDNHGNPRRIEVFSTYIMVDQRTKVPKDLLSLMAGKDAWMKSIRLRCKTCCTAFFAKDMADGTTCNDCFESFDPDAQ